MSQVSDYSHKDVPLNNPVLGGEVSLREPWMAIPTVSGVEEHRAIPDITKTAGGRSISKEHIPFTLSSSITVGIAAKRDFTVPQSLLANTNVDPFLSGKVATLIQSIAMALKEGLFEFSSPRIT